MPECFTYFPFDPHLITPAQGRTWHISTSLSVETLVSVCVENLTKNTSMSKNLIIKRLSALERTLFLKKKKKLLVNVHISKRGIMWKVLRAGGAARRAEVDATHDGLRHLPAGVVDHSLSRQFAEHNLSHLIRVIISRHPLTMRDVFFWMWRIVPIDFLPACHKDTHIYEFCHSARHICHHLQHKEVRLCTPVLHCDLCGSSVPYGTACPLLW